MAQYPITSYIIPSINLIKLIIRLRPQTVFLFLVVGLAFQLSYKKLTTILRLGVKTAFNFEATKACRKEIKVELETNLLKNGRRVDLELKAGLQTSIIILFR